MVTLQPSLIDRGECPRSQEMVQRDLEIVGVHFPEIFSERGEKYESVMVTYTLCSRSLSMSR